MKYDEPSDIWEGITPCGIHEHEMVSEGCVGCGAELTARGAVLEQMSAEAQDRLRGIAQQGGPMMPPHVPLEAQLSVLLDSILTDPRQRMQYEGEVGRRIMVMIKGMQESIKQPTLHVVKNGLKT